MRAASSGVEHLAFNQRVAGSIPARPTTFQLTPDNRFRFWLALLVLICVVGVHALAADDLIEQLATCKTSWLDWKNDPIQARKFTDSFNAAFAQKSGHDPYLPKQSVRVVGLPVLQAFPESVGTGVGFSVTLGAEFDTARLNVEKAIGKKLKDCSTSDGMRMCGLEIAAKRTLMLMASDKDRSARTLLGCYYFYAK